MRSLNDIKSWFKTGKFPTETQFSQTWDSFWHKEEKIDTSVINNLDKTLASKADRELVDNQVNDLRNNKEDVGVAGGLVNSHKDAQDAHQPLFDLKANDADVYHREVLDDRFQSHREDEELHLQEGERETWNAHKDDQTVHKTSDQIRSEIVDADIPDTIARDIEVAAAITGHNESGATHQDLRNSIAGIQDGAIIARKAEYAEKLGDAISSYTKPQLDVILNKLIHNLALNGDNFILTVIYQDGTTKEIDFPIEATVRDGRYNSDTNELVLILVSGQEIRIPAAGLNKIYSGKDSLTTTVSITSIGEISADLRQNAIQNTHLSTMLQDEIASHQTRMGDTKDNITTFTDQADRDSIDSGDRHSLLFGKIKKWLADLKAVAFTGRAADLITDATHRLTTDAEKTTWNNKCDTTDPRLYDARPANGGRADSASLLNVSPDENIPVYGDKLIFYQASGLNGSPDPNNWFNYLRMLHSNSVGYFSEIATSFTNVNDMYFRNMIAGELSPWKKVAGTEDIPTSLPSPHPLTIRVNGTTMAAYDGSSPQAVNIDAGAVTKTTIVNALNEPGEVAVNNHWVFTAGAGTASTSDMRFKHNVRDLGNLLDIVLNAPAFVYNWKEEDRDVIGSSAQYWEKYIPELVGEIEDEFHTKTLSYERLTVLLMKALQEENLGRKDENRWMREELVRIKEENTTFHKELDEMKCLIQKLIRK